IDRTILSAVGTGVVLLPVAGAVPTVVGLHVAADLETDVGARDVVEALAVERADSHVFDRLGLHRKIGSLGSGNRPKSCRGAEKKPFHNLHFEPPLRFMEGFGSDRLGNA